MTKKPPIPIVAPSSRPPYPEVAKEQTDVVNPVGGFNGNPISPINGYNPTLWNLSNPAAGTTPATPPPVNNTAPVGDTGQINNIYQTPEGQQQLANKANQIAMPIGTLQQQSTRAQSPEVTGNLTPGEKVFQERMGAGAAGLGAASRVTPTTDSSSAIGQTLAAGASGAAAGSAAGPWGAVIGGAVGLVAGGISAYTGLESARAQQRKIDKASREAAAWEKHKYEQDRQDRLDLAATNRSDTLEQLRYNRKTAAIQSQWGAMNQSRDMVNNLMSQNANYKTLLMSQVR